MGCQTCSIVSRELLFIDLFNEFFLRRAPADDDRLQSLPAQDRALSLKRVIPAAPSVVREVDSDGHSSWPGFLGNAGGRGSVAFQT